jgi:hypothetical protein
MLHQEFPLASAYCISAVDIFTTTDSLTKTMIPITSFGGLEVKKPFREGGPPRKQQQDSRQANKTKAKKVGKVELMITAFRWV